MATSVFATGFLTANQARNLSALPCNTVEGLIRSAAHLGETEIKLPALHDISPPSHAEAFVKRLEDSGYWVFCTFDATIISWETPRPGANVVGTFTKPWWKFW